MFLLVLAHPGFPGQIPQSRKTVVCVQLTRAERHKSSVDVQPYHCLFTARLHPLHGDNIPAAIAAATNIAMLFVYVCTVWSKPKGEVVFGSAEVKP